MSKKSRLILATALFGAALFGASCGGGGGGATAGGGSGGSGGGGGGGGGGTEPTVEGKVLALLDLSGASAGTLKPVTICELKDDNKAYCGNDLNPSANSDLQYVHEFENGNVVLRAGSTLYFFDGNQVKKLTTYTDLNGDENTASTGITIPSGAAYYATENFVIMNNSSGALVAVSKDGKVIKDTGVTLPSLGASCEAVTKGTTTYKLNVDGTISTTTIPTTLASAGGKHLVQHPTTNKIYLSSSKCSTSGAVVVEDTLSNVNDAKMVVDENGDFYIAVWDSTKDLYYYKVSGSRKTNLTPSTGITLNTGDLYEYALDGMGRLYAITAADTVEVYDVNGTPIGAATVSGATFTGLLAFADRALAKDSSDAYEITITSSGVNAVNKGTSSSTLYTALDACTDSTNTQAVNGAGTNFIRCLFDDGTDEILYSLRYDSGNYPSASQTLQSTSHTAVTQALFGAGKVLVPGPSGTIYLCSFNTTPVLGIACLPTDFPDLNTTNIGAYLKSNGNNVLYTSGSATKLGNIFDLSTFVSIPVSGLSGGNASFDLTKFAFGYQPLGATCATQIAYLSSLTASPKAYTVAQPSNACVKRILKVY